MSTATSSQPRLSLSLYPTQHRFCFDPRLFVSFIAGRGAGKTIAGVIRPIARGYLLGPGLGIVVAPTYQMLRDAPWRAALETWAPLIGRVNRAEMQITLKNGHEVIFRSAEDPNKLRGPSASWAWIDEAAMCAPETWPILLGVLRQGGRMGSCWITTTPKGFNWVYETFVEQANDDTAIYRVATSANPFTDDAFKRSLASQYPSEFARQELAGEFITLGAGLIRRNWFDVLPDAPEGLRWHRYWDLAVSTKASADFTASVRCAERDGVLYLHNPVRGRWEWPEARHVILQTMNDEPDTRTVGIENVAFQLAAVQEIQRAPQALRVAVRGVGVDRDKMSRALPWIAKAEAGLVKLCGPGWGPFLDEAVNFPEGQHDDMVDAVSGAVAMIANYSPTGGIFV